jgi:multidrug resistance efflux pump
VPYTQQQRDRLYLRRQELETDAQQQSSRATQLAIGIEEERRRVDYLRQYDIKLPPDYVVWSVPASPGSAVTEGQTVLDLADCDRRFVAVELPEREFEHIKAGDRAAVRLIGSDEWKYGEIRQVRGSAAHDDGRLLAAQIPVPTQSNITVEVSLPPDSAGPRGTSFCGIGRLAEVRFNRERPAILDRVSDYVRSFFNGPLPSSKVARQ